MSSCDRGEGCLFSLEREIGLTTALHLYRKYHDRGLRERVVGLMDIVNVARPLVTFPKLGWSESKAATFSR